MEPGDHITAFTLTIREAAILKQLRLLTLGEQDFFLNGLEKRVRGRDQVAKKLQREGGMGDGLAARGKRGAG